MKGNSVALDSLRLSRLLGVESTVTLVYHDVTVSTSNDARALVARGQEVPFLVVAGEQTGGRGRRGNAFSSPKGGLYLTLAIPATPIERDVGLLTSAVANVVCEVLEELFALTPGIKWVNDVYVEGGKLCGILVEGVRTGHGDGVALIGVGMNCLARPAVTGDVRPIALGDIVPRERIDLETLCVRIVRSIVSATRVGLDAREVVSGCRDRSILLGRRIAFNHEGKQLEGMAQAIDEQGRLVVDLGGATCCLDSAACNVRLA